MTIKTIVQKEKEISTAVAKATPFTGCYFGDLLKPVRKKALSVRMINALRL